MANTTLRNPDEIDWQHERDLLDQAYRNILHADLNVGRKEYREALDRLNALAEQEGR